MNESLFEFLFVLFTFSGMYLAVYRLIFRYPLDKKLFNMIMLISIVDVGIFLLTPGFAVGLVLALFFNILVDFAAKRFLKDLVHSPFPKIEK